MGLQRSQVRILSLRPETARETATYGSCRVAVFRCGSRGFHMGSMREQQRTHGWVSLAGGVTSFRGGRSNPATGWPSLGQVSEYAPMPGWVCLATSREWRPMRNYVSCNYMPPLRLAFRLSTAETCSPLPDQHARNEKRPRRALGVPALRGGSQTVCRRRAFCSRSPWHKARDTRGGGTTRPGRASASGDA